MVNHRPFVTDCSAQPGDIATDAVVELLRCGGAEQVSIAAVARWYGVTPSAIHQQHGGRAAFVDTVVSRFSWRWSDWVTRAGDQDSLPVRLPESSDEIDGVRAWRTLRTLAEGERRAGRDGPATAVDAVLDEERDHLRSWLQRHLGRAASADELEVLCVLADGLRERVASAHRPLTEPDAHRILSRYLLAAHGIEVSPPVRFDEW